MRVVLIAGARPNFVKIAPLRDALETRASVEPVIVHTGQHYDDIMSAAFFRELSIPAADFNLGVGSASHAIQTAKIMQSFDRFLDDHPTDLVAVVGDVNSTVACSLTAVKRRIPVAHVEAGLRSFDWSMPEEINRVVTDAVSSLLFTPSRDADENLLKEGRPREAIHFVGNVMVDTLLKFRERALANEELLFNLNLTPREYAVLTLHRPANVDERGAFEGILGALEETAEELPIVYPMHPRSVKTLEAVGLGDRARSIEGLRLTPPMGYLDFIMLEANARMVMTDSGGVQEETTVLGVPCLTLRPNTERPVTVTEGTNRVVGTDREAIVSAAREVLAREETPSAEAPELWDGRAAERIARILEEFAA
ncbi:MAG: UDP-N-acetylglucosamine 2-epimerase (non-hydrolyzing) [Candidatus Eisenbacteria bacterium]|nr:UDP-N-acetylglucosamine 2-epimerase (non-hydrolyzing) [Candidatus Eisenbacteria bacterium]